MSLKYKLMEAYGINSVNAVKTAIEYVGIEALLAKPNCFKWTGNDEKVYNRQSSDILKMLEAFAEEFVDLEILTAYINAFGESIVTIVGEAKPQLLPFFHLKSDGKRAVGLYRILKLIGVPELDDLLFFNHYRWVKNVRSTVKEHLMLNKDEIEQVQKNLEYLLTRFDPEEVERRKRLLIDMSDLGLKVLTNDQIFARIPACDWIEDPTTLRIFDGVSEPREGTVKCPLGKLFGLAMGATRYVVIPLNNACMYLKAEDEYGLQAKVIHHPRSIRDTLPTQYELRPGRHYNHQEPARYENGRRPAPGADSVIAFDVERVWENDDIIKCAAEFIGHGLDLITFVELIRNTDSCIVAQRILIEYGKSLKSMMALKASI